MCHDCSLGFGSFSAYFCISQRANTVLCKKHKKTIFQYNITHLIAFLLLQHSLEGFAVRRHLLAIIYHDASGVYIISPFYQQGTILYSSETTSVSGIIGTKG